MFISRRHQHVTSVGGSIGSVFMHLLQAEVEGPASREQRHDLHRVVHRSAPSGPLLPARCPGQPPFNF